ncbi:MAG: type III pantothenate kinase [Bacteroidaceae bacterium]|nr:type III pantothenate kinase [Bacteroidaceae bacterium]
MDLIIDIGNTAGKLVLFENGEPVKEVRTDNRTLAALSDLDTSYPIECAIVGTVVPLTEETKATLEAKPYPVLFLNETVTEPILNQYGIPKGEGADRIAAIVGATTKFPNKDLLIIDAGTCITYDLLVGGKYVGGTISPGARLRLLAMHEHTALLPVAPQEGPLPEIGYDLDTALRCGALNGMRYEIEGHIRTFTDKYPELLVFLTGGDGFNLDSSLKSTIFADKFLVPRGYYHILACNRPTV